MPRFMTREVDGIFKKLENECGLEISVSVQIERWHFSHSSTIGSTPAMNISIHAAGHSCIGFYQHRHESVEAMVDAVIAKMREWRTAE